MQKDKYLRAFVAAEVKQGYWQEFKACVSTQDLEQNSLGKQECIANIMLVLDDHTQTE